MRIVTRGARWAKNGQVTARRRDWLGRPIIEHYNAKGDKTGYSKMGTNFWGSSITERYNAKGEKAGYNKKSTTAFGTPITERYNAQGEKTGYNKKSTTAFGTPITEGYNDKGEKTGYSKRGSTFWGTPITEHFNDARPIASPSPNPSGASAGSYESSQDNRGINGRRELAESNHVGAILIVATLVGLGIFGLRLGNILTQRINPTASYDSSGHTGHVEPAFDPAEFSWANDNHALLAKLLFQYGTDLIESFEKYPDLVLELQRLCPGFDPTGIGSTDPSLLAKLRDGRMLLIMAGCRPHACTTYRVCIGMDVNSREVFLYKGGEQEQFFGRNDSIARGLLQYVSAGNWPTISENEAKLRDSIAQSLRVHPEAALPKIEAAGTAPTASTAKVVQSDPATGFVTIEATAAGFGTLADGWSTVITEGSDQRILLYKGFPNAGIGDRLRITYDADVPDDLQGPKGTAGHMTGVIVSMDVIHRAQ